MKILERSVENVHSAAQGELSADELYAELAALMSEFDESVDMLSSAREYYWLVSPQWDMIGRFGYMCFDGLRTLLPGVNIIFAAIACMVVCALMVINMLNGFSGTVITKPEQWLKKLRKKRIRAIKNIFRRAMPQIRRPFSEGLLLRGNTACSALFDS